MKFAPKTLLAAAVAVIALLCVGTSMAAEPAIFDPPPPPTPPPPPGLPLDSNVFILVAIAIILGFYLTRKTYMKKAGV